MARFRTYERPMLRSWFLKRPAYFLFMLRELTSVFLAVYLVILLVFLAHFGDGQRAFAECLASLASPPWYAFHAVALAASLFHAVTWFNLTPKAMPVFIGPRKAPAPLVAIGMGYAPWIVVSILVLWAVGP